MASFTNFYVMMNSSSLAARTVSESLILRNVAVDELCGVIAILGESLGMAPANGNEF